MIGGDLDLSWNFEIGAKNPYFEAPQVHCRRKPDMEKLREYEFRVEPRDVDFTKRATITALGDYILHTAGEDADANGFGVAELNAKHNSSWVLSRMAVEVFRMPVEKELLRIQTWVSEVSRAMTTRNFRIYGAERELLAAAVTNWAMINLATRRPMDLTRLDEYRTMVQPAEPPITLPERLGTPDGAQVGTHTVAYSDVDFNCHANSMKYLQWVVDTLPLGLLRSGGFARVDINFIQESLHGQTLSIIADNANAANRAGYANSASNASSADCADTVAGDSLLFEIRNADMKPVCRIRLRPNRHTL